MDADVEQAEIRELQAGARRERLQKIAALRREIEATETEAKRLVRNLELFDEPAEDLIRDINERRAYRGAVASGSWSSNAAADPVGVGGKQVGDRCACRYGGADRDPARGGETHERSTHLGAPLVPVGRLM